MKYLFTFLFACCFFGPLSGAESTSWTRCKQQVVAKLPMVQGWCTPEKALRMMELIHQVNPDVCVEVGVFGGSSFYPTAAAMAFNKHGMGYAIDPWKNSDCVIGETGENQDWWSKVNLDEVMNGFIHVMHVNKLDSYYKLMRMTSRESVTHFADESIDILHIDGNHSVDSALFDVQHWLPKVKKGGYIWFDDMNWESTGPAIDYLLQYCVMDPSSKRTDLYGLFQKK